MSWSFSPGLAAAFLEECCSDTDPSVPSNTTPTPDQFYWPDKPTEHSRISRFGMTCEVFPGNRGAELLTWYLAAFRARTSPSQEMAPESMASEADCGEKWPGSLARYDRATSSWKTAQRSLLGDSELSSVTWPRSGLMLDGQCWELPRLALTTDENDSGYWPTPNTVGYRSDGELQMLARKLRDHAEYLAMSDKACRSKRERFWPTPTVCGNYNRNGASATSGDGLATAVMRRMYPTATATAYKGWSPNHNRADTDDRLDYTVEREAFRPGQQTPPMRLNPDWCEWLMGWPIGHTELKPLGTDRFREYERQHGECLTCGVRREA